MKYTIIAPDFLTEKALHIPAVSSSQKVKSPFKKRPGRPVGSVTQFPGSSIFAASQGVTPTHFHRVLIGERVSRRLINLYAAFLRERGMPWPSEAKAKPEKF